MAGLRAPKFLARLRVWAIRRGSRLATVAMALLLAAVGWVAVQWRELLWSRVEDQVVPWEDMGMDPLQRLSFDLPFLVRHSLPGWMKPIAGPLRSTGGVVILYIDDESATRLGQPLGQAWSRAVYARLLDKLAQDGARAVMFDLVFDNPTPEDDVFAKALSRHGNVILGARLESNIKGALSLEVAQRVAQVGIATEKLSILVRPLYSAAKGWGLLTFRPKDADNGVRRLFVGKRRDDGLDPWPSAAWQLAKATGAALPEDEDEWFQRRWINFHGPAQAIWSLSSYLALVKEEDGGVPPGFFKDQVVFVGARSQLASGPDQLPDEFSTPWSLYWGRAQTPGVEIHATAYLNLMQHDWLERFPVAVERWVVVGIGLALGLLRLLKPWRAVLCALLAAVVIFSAACLGQWHGHVWGNWAVPVLLQIPLAGTLAVVSRYYLEERRKRKVQAAFGLYTSRHLAAQIADTEISLAPGGQKVVATMLFTDLAGYTALAEKLGDSKRLGEELIRYFTRTADEILAEDGMVIKFIGDSVYAAWGAPFPHPDHAVRAVRAAWKVAQVCDMDVTVTRPDGSTEIVPVHTRIGIHTGEALAGNLGSTKRFDYTLIGDAVNFASRLEGANKFLGTTVLVSDDTVQEVAGKFLFRRIGSFVVMGKSNAVVVHELVGIDPAVRLPWMETFESGLAAWTAGDFEAARTAFEAVNATREGGDGPSKFYLERIKTVTPGADWTGTVVMEAK